MVSTILGLNTSDHLESHVVHFRGRKLLGQVVHLPEGYHATALRVTQDSLETHPDGDSAKQADPVVEIDKIVVWKHESLADAAEDPYLKGMGEWMEFADLIHAS
jgi:hypothetical protein